MSSLAVRVCLARELICYFIGAGLVQHQPWGRGVRAGRITITGSGAGVLWLMVL